MKTSLLKVKALFLMGLIVFIAASCGEDDDGASTSDITGVWTIASANIQISVGDKSLIDYLIDALAITNTEAQQFQDIFEQDLTEDFAGTIEFKSDNTYMVDFGGDSDSGTWSQSSDGNTITMDAGTVDETELDILSVSSNTLKIGFSEEVTEDLDYDGTDETMSIEFELNLEK